MLRVESNTKLDMDEHRFTEFEEDILFDDDDPDFDHTAVHTVPIFFPLPSNMSLASVHPVELRSSHSSLTTLSHSLDDISSSWNSLSQQQLLHSEHVMTIEELRLQMSSCFTCGVSWTDSHVSLDCSECGGYAMERPCTECDGGCGAMWKRDCSMTHASGKARWVGECARKCSSSGQQEHKLEQSSGGNAATQELTTRLEKLSANS